MDIVRHEMITFLFDIHMQQDQNTRHSLLTDNYQSTKQDMIFELFSRVGTIGKYQYITLIFWCISQYLCGGITLMIPFLLYQDPFNCPQAYPNQTCTEYVCSLPQAERTQYIPPQSMSTMANQFGDYRCSPQSSILDFAVMLIYSSTIFSYLLLSFFGDFFGRKKFMIFGLILTIGGILLSILSLNLMMGAVGVLGSCLGTQWLYSISLMYISQTVSEQHRQKFMVIAQLFYGLGHILNAGFYYWLLDWQLVFVYFYLLPAGMLLAAVILFMVESPICLIRKLPPAEVKKSLLWIASVNGIKDAEYQLKQIQQIKELQQFRQKEEEAGSKFSIIDLFRFPSLRTLTICLALLQNSILFLFYAPTLMIAQFQFDIFVNGVVIGASSLLSYPFCYFTITKIKRKSLGLTCFGIVLLCSSVLIFFWHPKNDEVAQPVSENIGILVAFFIIGFVITVEYIFYEVYLLQLYPTQVRLIGGSFATVMGGITISFADFIIDGCNNGGFSVMIVFCLFSVLSLLISVKLPETWGKTPPDFIRELAQKMAYSLESSQVDTLGSQSIDVGAKEGVKGD